MSKIKKQVILFCIFIFIAVPTFLYAINHKKDESKAPEFKNDYDRANYVENFAKTQQKDPGKEINTNEGGYSGILIKNKKVLLDYMNTDAMLSVNDYLSNSFKYIGIIRKDTIKLSGDQINKYYEKNKDTISGAFNINDLDTFIKFVHNLDFISEKGSLIDASIQESSIVKNDDEVNFNIVLKSSDEKEQLFNIKVIVQEDNQKGNKLVYWQ